MTYGDKVHDLQNVLFSWQGIPPSMLFFLQSISNSLLLYSLLPFPHPSNWHKGKPMSPGPTSDQNSG